MAAKNNFRYHKIRYFKLFLALFLAACNNQNNNKNDNKIAPSQSTSNLITQGVIARNKFTTIDKNIRSIYQGKNGKFWFGTNTAGVFCYDGQNLIQYNSKDGLANNQVQSIQEDIQGNIWFANGGFNFSKFDGKLLISYSTKDILKETNQLICEAALKPYDIWLPAGGGAFRHTNENICYLPLIQSISNSKKINSNPFNLSSYAVYSILKDKKGNIWFGTQSQGVCCYNGKTFTWYIEKGLGGSAVLAIFEDNKGNLWFGNNGAGLFKYDGKTLINVTAENRLSNPEFKLSGKSGPGTMARVYAINEDQNGNLWIGTVDAGAWRFDGNNFTNYTTQNGLSSNAINTIYKDKNAELWFGTDSNGICKYDGNSFYQFELTYIIKRLELGNLK